ncbi:MAG: hypothetical protein IJL88_06230 [Clostridia bacterium]|nr:hypothetical protein [Clostridia bacterium]
MRNWLRKHFQRDMIRPLIYKIFTRFILMLLVLLLWNQYLQPRTPHLTLRMVFPVAGIVFLLCAYLVYLRMDGLNIPRMKPLKKPKKDPFRAYGDMTDYLDEPPVSFEDLPKEEQDTCSLLANISCGILFFLASCFPL